MLTLRCLLFCAFTSAFVSSGFSQSPGKPGNFDYYLLTLSWSPEFCHSHQDRPECAQHLGFVVHGLWPQFTNGRWPAHCQTNQPEPKDNSIVNGIMPQELIPHEWSTHGTCTGLSGDDYLRMIRRVFTALTIPADLKAPQRSFTERPAVLKQDFAQANKSLQPADLAVNCRSGYLTELEICLNKAGVPMACPAVQDCNKATIRIPPVR